MPRDPSGVTGLRSLVSLPNFLLLFCLKKPRPLEVASFGCHGANPLPPRGGLGPSAWPGRRTGTGGDSSPSSFTAPQQAWAARQEGAGGLESYSQVQGQGSLMTPSWSSKVIPALQPPQHLPLQLPSHPAPAKTRGKLRVPSAPSTPTLPAQLHDCESGAARRHVSPLLRRRPGQGQRPQEKPR